MNSNTMSDSRISFTFEDTQDHCYRDIILILQSFGWHKISYRKRSKLERKRSVNACMDTCCMLYEVCNSSPYRLDIWD